MVTTIQIPHELKRELDAVKQGRDITYAQVLQELLAKDKRRKEIFLLKEYATKYGEQSKKEVKEWASTDVDWEY